MTVLKNEINGEIIRIKHIDIYRGIGILFMLMGHVGVVDELDIFIHSICQCFF